MTVAGPPNRIGDSTGNHALGLGRPSRRVHALGLAVLCLTLFWLGWLISQHSRVRSLVDELTTTRVEEYGYLPSNGAGSEHQLVMVFFGASGCGWSNRPELPDAVEQIKVRMAATAGEHGMSFKSVGVALDWDPELGLSHMAGFGRFNEISAGYGLGNSAALQILWSEGMGEVATPQIVLYERVFTTPNGKAGVQAFQETAIQPILSRVGLKAILSWVEAGMPLPGSSA